jgi:hypothetical protein
VERRAAGLSGRAWLLLLGLLAVLVLVFGPVFRGGGQAQELQRSVPAAGVSSVGISVSSVAVSITQLAGTEIAAELSGAGARAFDLTVEQSGGLLRIDVTRSQGFLPFGWFGDARLEVGLPASEFELLRAVSSSGAIHARDFRAANAEFSSSSGAITLQQARVAGTLQAGSSSGRISLEQVSAAQYELSSNSGRISATGVSGAVQARSSSGSIDLQTAEISSDWTLQSSSGSITVSLAQAPQALRVEFQGSSGSWSVPRGWNLDVTSEARNRLSAETGSGGPLLRATTSSGSFTLR